MSKPVVIVAAGRTAIGAFGGALSGLKASDLGATVIKALLQETGLAPEEIDEVILGQVLTAGGGQNPARQAAMKAGLPVATTSYGVNKLCGSGLKSVHLGAQSIMLGDKQIVIAGGQENMSQAPHLLAGSRTGQKLGHWQMPDSMIMDGLWDAYYDCHMGITAENIAERFTVTREDQDAFALASQQKAAAAQQADRFKDEIVPVEAPQRRGDPLLVDKDEGPRGDTTGEKLAGLRTVFKKYGSVTAGNASSINDGAAAVVLMSEEMAKEKGLPVLARIKAFASAGVSPDIMGTGPVPASRQCLEKAGWQAGDLDLVEANEAFAAQALYVNREMGFDDDKVNVNGGAVALGHPIGATGARILTTLLYEMQKRDSGKGLATMCIGGGMGVAMAVERP